MLIGRRTEGKGRAGLTLKPLSAIETARGQSGPGAGGATGHKLNSKLEPATASRCKTQL